MSDSHPDGVARRRLVDELRKALGDPLTFGSWANIQDDHRKVDLEWRPDFEPGWGKPRYITRVLDGLPDEEVLALAQRVRERFPERGGFWLKDALSWLETNGIARVSELTRRSLGKALDGWRLHPSESPREVMDRFGHAVDSRRFEYATDGSICTVQEVFDLQDVFVLLTPAGRSSGQLPEPRPPKVTRATHLMLLEGYGFRGWPDARLFAFVEFLVHPAVRQGDEQYRLAQTITRVLLADGFELAESGHVSGHPIFKVRPAVGGVAGRPKNLIFASSGLKPELGFVDAINNDVVILKHAEHCLIFEDPIGPDGLRWTRLVEWWAARQMLDASDTSTRKRFGSRLGQSLGSPPERRLFNAYFRIFQPRLRDALPALIPQVYLHYDPVTLRELRARCEDRRFDVQRMDFLLLLPNGVRVVVEIDGQQHYSTGSGVAAKPSPAEYARTTRADRRLRLAGYEVYRFGGHELRDDEACAKVVDEFFTQLFERHHVDASPSP